MRPSARSNLCPDCSAPPSLLHFMHLPNLQNPPKPSLFAFAVSSSLRPSRYMAPNPVPLCPRRLAASGLRLHASESAFREGSATIVMPTGSAAFLNPVQEFNRDLSVLAIRTWSETTDAELKKKWDAKMARRKASSQPKKRGLASTASHPSSTKRVKGGA